MSRSEKHDGPIQKWGKAIHWESRVRAVCKPCWEIKYCPYGPLVEEFPLRSERDERSCRIFGHDCPVFHTAEPFTETKELRNISRSIPRVTQFRVLKRENQICSICGRSVKDEDVEFDHIIPWSKGGSSDEHNIRLLCADCNRRKGTKFEDERLVKDLGELMVKPVGIQLAQVLIEWVTIAHQVFLRTSKYPSGVDFCRYDGRRKVRDYDEKAAQVIADIDEFFSQRKPREVKQTVFSALRYRWGFADRQIHKLGQTASMFKLTADELLSAELSLANRLGWRVKLTEAAKKSWLRL